MNNFFIAVTQRGARSAAHMYPLCRV